MSSCCYAPNQCAFSFEVSQDNNRPKSSQTSDGMPSCFQNGLKQQKSRGLSELTTDTNKPNNKSNIEESNQVGIKVMTKLCRMQRNPEQQREQAKIWDSRPITSPINRLKGLSTEQFDEATTASTCPSNLKHRIRMKCRQGIIRLNDCT